MVSSHCSLSQIKRPNHRLQRKNCQRIALVVTSSILQSIHKKIRSRAVELKCRHHEAELRQSREEWWAYEQEVAAAREKLAHLKTTLEDRRKDIVSYKVTELRFVQQLSLLWLLGVTSSICSSLEVYFTLSGTV